MLQILTYILVFSCVGLLVVDLGYMMYRNCKHYINDDNRFGNDFAYPFTEKMNKYFGDVPFCIIVFVAVMFMIFYFMGWLMPKADTVHKCNLIFWCNVLYTVPSLIYIAFACIMKHARLITRMKKQGKL